MPTDSEILAWLLKQAPETIAAIAWRFGGAACESDDPREAIVRAMEIERARAEDE